MALTPSEVYYLTVDELRRECFKRGLDSGGTVRSLRQRLTGQIRSSHMEEVKTSEKAQASVATDLRNDISETSPSVLGFCSHAGSGDSPTPVLVELLRQFPPCVLKSLKLICDYL
jgi:CRP-like cAMP-binding protein